MLYAERCEMKHYANEQSFPLARSTDLHPTKSLTLMLHFDQETVYYMEFFFFLQRKKRCVNDWFKNGADGTKKDLRPGLQRGRNVQSLLILPFNYSPQKTS